MPYLLSIHGVGSQAKKHTTIYPHLRYLLLFSEEVKIF